MKKLFAMFALLSLAFCQAAMAQSSSNNAQRHRLYDSMTLFVSNPEGKAFDIDLALRDLNHIARGPAELMVKVYRPDGSLAVREFVKDDGITARSWHPPVAGWDHEAWYYATSYARGLEPMNSFSVFTDPARVEGLPARDLQWSIDGGQKGVYRIALYGCPDHIVDISLSPDLSFGVAGSPDWIHGHGDLLARKHLYIPPGTLGVELHLLENDRPGHRRAVLRNSKGDILLEADGINGLSHARHNFDDPAAWERQMLTLEVEPGQHDYLLRVAFIQPEPPRHHRSTPYVFGVLCDDAQTARAIKNGVIEHDGQVFWQAYQVALHDFVKGMDKEPELDKAWLTRRGYVSPGSHERPHGNSADVLMHHWADNKQPELLDLSLRDMYLGTLQIGPQDHVMHGRNLAYEMGTYSYFYHRPAWRILQQSDAPEEAKQAIRDFIIQVGDRLAFSRGIELVNGNSLASLVQALRYCYEASGDPLQEQLFNDYWDRFANGGFGERIGVGASGGVQESFGYDHHYGGYIIRGWKAVLADFEDPRFQKVYDGVKNLYTYTWSREGIPAVWNSRTHSNPPGGAYSPNGPYPWQGEGTSDLTMSVNDGNEFFVARRRDYYLVTYAGRLTPTWMGAGFHGQIGFGGGAISQLHVAGYGPVLLSNVHQSYGGGQHVSQWRNFHLHSLVGTTADGLPLVTANSEPVNRLEGDTVTSEGEVRQSSIRFTRKYTYHPKQIDCSIELARSRYHNVYGIYGGLPSLGGHVTEAYEMIPFHPQIINRTNSKRSQDQTKVIAINADGQSEALDEEPVAAKAIIIDRNGFGVRIALDRVRPVFRGQKDTVMIELAKGRTPAEDVALEYTLQPYVGPLPLDGIKPVALPTLAVLDPLAAPEAVAAALKDMPTHDAFNDGAKLIEARFAMSGDSHLALHARVWDQNVKQNDTPWRGSCVEVFGAMPTRDDIGQVFLVPASDNKPAKAYVAQGGKQVPTDAIALTTTPAEGGYTLDALIPLSLLRIEKAEDAARLEVQVTAAPKGSKSYSRATIFGSTRAYDQAYRYGRFQIQRAGDEAAE